MNMIEESADWNFGCRWNRRWEQLQVWQKQHLLLQQTRVRLLL